jgi:hypothetical protein
MKCKVKANKRHRCAAEWTDTDKLVSALLRIIVLVQKLALFAASDGGHRVLWQGQTAAVFVIFITAVMQCCCTRHIHSVSSVYWVFYIEGINGISHSYVKGRNWDP